MGKVKRVRNKLHQDAVRIRTDTGDTAPSPGKSPETPVLNLNTKSTPERQISPDVKSPDVKVFNFPKRVFAGTVISPEALVQTLHVPEAPAEQTETHTTEQTRGAGQKHQSKKEKMKERRDRWMGKISAIKLERVKQAELKRRKATPVVGDMRILADALPELHTFIRAPASRKQKGVVKKKAEPTDFCQMKPAQKRKLLQMEMSRFSEAMKDSTFKSSPLTAIGDHLRKRLKQEDEQN